MPGECILLIDDDIRVGQMIQPMLPEYDFICVETASDGLAALKSSRNIDLIICDYKLKGVTGIEVLQRIKEMKLGMGVIMLTAYGSKDLVIESLESEADGYVEKPIDFMLLKEKIDKILRKTNFYKECETIDEKISMTQQALKDVIHERVTLKDLSKRGAFSEKYFSRAFREKTGKTFTQFRLEEKMDRAKMLLKNESMTLNRISEMLGYVNPSAFMKMFKKVVGVTPSQYRKSLET
jgi:YesN/AraC family two-component response regulator